MNSEDNIIRRIWSCMNSQICRKRKSNKLKPWFKILGPIIMLSGFVYSILIIFFHSVEDPLSTIGFLGFFNFAIVLFGMYLMTDTWEFGEGEFRKAITISVLTVFFAIWAFGEGITISESDVVLKGLFDNFWAIVITVIGFYFASRAYENR